MLSNRRCLIRATVNAHRPPDPPPGNHPRAIGNSESKYLGQNLERLRPICRLPLCDGTLRDAHRAARHEGGWHREIKDGF
jgi:hypothetical protein